MTAMESIDKLLRISKHLDEFIKEIDEDLEQLAEEQNEKLTKRKKHIDELESINEQIEKILLLEQHKDKVADLLDNPHGLSGYSISVIERIFAGNSVSFEEKNLFRSIMLNRFNTLIEC